MSRAWIPKLGKGSLGGAAGVKSAKLCVKQDQIGKRLSVAAQAFGLIAKELEQSNPQMNDSPRQNPAYR